VKERKLGLQTSIEAKNKEIADTVRNYVSEQGEKWREMPYWALQIERKKGWDLDQSYAYEEGYLCVDNSSNSYHRARIFIDCEKAEIVFLKDYQGERWEKASDSQIVEWLQDYRSTPVEEKLLAEKMIEEFKKEADAPYPSYYHKEKAETERWRRVNTIRLKYHLPFVIIPRPIKPRNEEERLATLPVPELAKELRAYSLEQAKMWKKLYDLRESNYDVNTSANPLSPVTFPILTGYGFGHHPEMWGVTPVGLLADDRLKMLDFGYEENGGVGKFGSTVAVNLLDGKLYSPTCGAGFRKFHWREAPDENLVQILELHGVGLGRLDAGDAYANIAAYIAENKAGWDARHRRDAELYNAYFN
jgi:hypothetical protein